MEELLNRGSSYNTFLRPNPYSSPFSHRNGLKNLKSTPSIFSTPGHQSSSFSTRYASPSRRLHNSNDDSSIMNEGFIYDPVTEIFSGGLARSQKHQDEFLAALNSSRPNHSNQEKISTLLNTAFLCDQSSNTFSGNTRRSTLLKDTNTSTSNSHQPRYYGQSDASSIHNFPSAHRTFSYDQRATSPSLLRRSSVPPPQPTPSASFSSTTARGNHHSHQDERLYRKQTPINAFSTSDEENNKNTVKTKLKRREHHYFQQKEYGLTYSWGEIFTFVLELIKIICVVIVFTWTFKLIFRLG